MTPISDEAVTYVGTTAMVPLVVARALERRLEAAERDAAIAENEGYRRGMLNAAETINAIREQSKIVAVNGMRGDLNVIYRLEVLSTYSTPDGLTIDVQLP